MTTCVFRRVARLVRFSSELVCLGRGEDEVGVAWKAIKQRNTEPDIDSIGGSGAADVGGGDWDSDNTEGGEPEEPTEPEVEAPEL